MKKVTGILVCSTLALMLGACDFGTNVPQNHVPEPNTTHAQLVGMEEEDDNHSDSDGVEDTDVDLPIIDDTTDEDKMLNSIQHKVEYIKDYANRDEFVDDDGEFKKAIICGYEYFDISDDYPELKESLEQKHNHDETEFEDTKQYAMELWQEDDFDYEGGMGYKYVSKAYVSRAEDKIFSFIEKNESYFGGAHDDVNIQSFTYDSVTGEELGLQEFIRDDGSLSMYLAEFLYDSYDSDMFFAADVDELAETIEGMLYGEGDEFYYPIEFSVYNKGVILYFNEYTIAPYVCGIPVAYLDFDRTPEYLNSEYFDYTSEDYTIEVPDYITFWADVDGDNTKDNIQIGHKKEWVEFVEEYEYGGIRIWKSDDSTEVSTTMYTLGDPEVYYAQIDNKAYIYVQVEEMRDRYRIYGYSYSDGQLDSIGDIPGKCHGLLGAGEFNVTAMLDIMSTYIAEASFKINEDGTFEQISDSFEIRDMDTMPLVSSKELYATLVNSNGEVLEEDYVLPAGTTFYFRSTDAVDSVRFETSEGDYILFENVGESGRTVCSYPLYEAFEQIWFAG